ncbi:MAG: Rieske 2Fe-2S domain-containing protein [Candidatus Kapaibacterium sp.]
MIIQSLGHAGFLIEAGDDIILADPWLAPAGAYAASWFPFPSNASVNPDTLERATILYISHWHQDHLDEWFLQRRSAQFKERVRVIIPNFKYKKLLESIKKCGYQKIEELPSFEGIRTDSGTEIAVIYDTNPLFVDSALFIRSDGINFLNENDCKLSVADEEAIVSRYGAVDIFTAQFSGATFHPTCYTYDAQRKIQISSVRRKAKFERIVSSIIRLKASYYIPSAGPACFLSDDLRELNLNPATVFSTAQDLKEYIRSEHPSLLKTCTELLPGDKLTISNDKKVELEKTFIDDYLSQEYIDRYAKNKADIISSEIEKYRKPLGDILSDTKNHFRSFCTNVPELGKLAATNLEINLTGEKGGFFFIDTSTGIISETLPRNSQQRYTLSLDTFWMRVILDGLLTWEDFILSFRFSIDREPDTYNEALIAFLHLETAEERQDYITFHEFIASGEKERILRVCDGITIEYDRYCPHNGEDLSCATINDGILTCPRHFWQFSIENGKGINNSGSINLTQKKN